MIEQLTQSSVPGFGSDVVEPTALVDPAAGGVALSRTESVVGLGWRIDAANQSTVTRTPDARKHTTGVRVRTDLERGNEKPEQDEEPVLL